MSARSIGLELIQLVRDVSQQTEEGFAPDPSDMKAQLPIDEMERSPFHSHGEALVGRLFAVLSEDGWAPDHVVEEVLAGKVWSFGRVLETAALRPIRNGSLEPKRIVPLVLKVLELVVHFLITLPGGKDFLESERHGPVGWHYHYLDKRKRGSDVILCWDTRWTPIRPRQLRPLFQEQHGAGKAHFQAWPDLWADPKGQSMHVACAPDLKTRPINQFRCAAKKAKAVWSRGSILTP